MKYEVMRGFCLGGGVDVTPGEIAEIPDNVAPLYLRQGRIKPLPAPVDMNKAALLAAIGLAESVDVLNELVPEDETDSEIIAAYKTRVEELEAPDGSE